MTSQDRFVIDSFAWFEYFSGSEAGKRAVSHIEEGRVLTPTIVVAELSEKYLVLITNMRIPAKITS